MGSPTSPSWLWSLWADEPSSSLIQRQRVKILSNSFNEVPALTAGISVLRTELGIAEGLYEGQEQIAVAGLGNAKRTSGSRNSSSTWMTCKGGVCAVCAINPCLLLKRFHFLLLLVVSVSILCIKIAFWLPGQVKSETGSLASCPHFTTLPQFVLVSETTQTGQNSWVCG